MVKSQVIVISGITASGRTTLVKQLHKEFPESRILSFDDYNMGTLPPVPVDNPLKTIMNQFDADRLMEDFLQLYDKVPLILLDFPFGYKLQVLQSYIDKVVYLKIPLDIALARQIIRDYPEKSAEEIIARLQNYLDYARQIFIDHGDFISEDADLILDGPLSLEEEVQAVKRLMDED